MIQGQVPSIEAEELFKSIENQTLVLLDVREHEEFEYTKLKNSKLVPLGELQQNLDKLASEYLTSNIVLVCRSGQRSEIATQIMHEFGFTNVRNLSGGLLSYSNFDPEILKY